jgi:hypothetical protein
VKRLITAIFALLYLALSSGVVLNIHYCMGKIASVKLQNFESKACKCGDSSKSMPCCKTEFKIVKIEDDQQIASIIHPADLFPVAFLHSFIFPSFEYPETTNHALLTNHSPPLTAKTPLYIQYSVFRI